MRPITVDPSPVGVTFDDPIGVLGHELDSSPAIAWLKDLDGRYVYVNRRYGEALRVAPERIVGYRDGAAHPPRDRRRGAVLRRCRDGQAGPLRIHGGRL